jgi:hypothetical protein
MLNLRKDLYARLVISSHKRRELNKPFRVSHIEMSNVLSVKKAEDEILERSKIEKEASKAPMSKSVVLGAVSKGHKTEKIDEKVAAITDDPKLSEIKTELEFAEALLKKIRSIDKHNKKIPIIEENISRLKAMLDQKTYI